MASDDDSGGGEDGNDDNAGGVDSGDAGNDGGDDSGDAYSSSNPTTRCRDSAAKAVDGDGAAAQGDPAEVRLAATMSGLGTVGPASPSTTPLNSSASAFRTHST